MTPRDVTAAEPDAAARRLLWEALAQLRADDRGALAVELYARLFAARPQARALLGRLDVAAQARKLAAALDVLSDCAGDRPRLGHEAIRLGARHARLGIARADYDAFAGILAELLAQRQSAVPRDAAVRFWTQELAAIIDVMQVVGVD